jgi:hypothetical protein
MEAVKEDSTRPGDTQTFGGKKARDGQAAGGDPRNQHRTDANSQWGKDYTAGATRNLRNVWTQPQRYMKLRDDLTKEQKEYVTKRLIQEGLL